MSLIRNDAVYVTRETRRMLRMIAKSRSTGEAPPGTFSASSPTTADQIADELLQDCIRAKYPALVEADKEYKALEKRMIEAARVAA